MADYHLRRQDDGLADSVVTAAMMAAFVVAICGMMPVLMNVNSYVQSQRFSGTTVTNYFDATNTPQKKSYSPSLSYLYLTNVGDYVALVKLNEGSGSEEFTIYPGEVITVNRLGASERVSSVTVSAPDHSSVVRLIGEY